VIARQTTTFSCYVPPRRAEHGLDSPTGFGIQTCFRLLAGWPTYPSKGWPSRC